jgi:hypothetical protein
MSTEGLAHWRQLKHLRMQVIGMAPEAGYLLALLDAFSVALQRQPHGSHTWPDALSLQYDIVKRATNFVARFYWCDRTRARPI